MDSADALLGGLASGDSGPHASEQTASLEPALKREHDSTDDFEHLEREGRPAGEALHSRAAAAATLSFLDMERDVFDAPHTPFSTDTLEHVADMLDHVADKFTDSESDADTAGESPLHRPAPAVPASAPAPAPTPLLDLLSDPLPVTLPHAPVTPPAEKPAPPAPAPLPTPKAAPAPAPEPVKPADAPHQPAVAPQQPAVAPQQPAIAPHQPAVAPHQPAPKQTPAEPTRAPIAHVIEAEVIFCQMGLDAWFDPQRLHPEVESLIYWRAAARSGAALGAGLALLIALACCSVVSVLAYVSLLALSAAVAFRIYKNILQAVQKTNDGHPFKWLLEQDISVPAERAQALAAAATAHLNAAGGELRRLFLVEDLVDSLKFGVLLWCLTYVGACFNGITLIILGWIALFTLPKAYEMNKAQVDANLELARAKINEISAKVRAAVPIGRKAESEKDK